MPTPIRAFWRNLRDFLRRHTGWIGEMTTAIVTAFAIFATAFRHVDAPLLPSLRVLDHTMPDEYWLCGASVAVLIQFIGLLVLWPGRRWVRFGAAVLMAAWWGNLAWALAVSLGTPLHQTVVAYLGYSFLNGYAILTLLEGDA